MNRLSPTVLALALVAAACGPDQPSTAPLTAADDGAPVVEAAPEGESASLVRVLDGDSFEAEVDGEAVEVRLLGINAPEGRECHGDAARARLGEFLDAGPILLVAGGQDDRDRFGRLLRDVYAGGVFVNGAMTAEGHAVALQGGAPREADLVDLSDDAFAAGLGMWAATACEEATVPKVNIIEIEYDPAGRDRQNRAEEWIVVVNDGDGPVEMSEWILRDESTSHRYVFPRGETLPPGQELRIRSGCGEDGPSDRYWCADDAVWSNGGDTVILQTASGTVVARVRYDGDF